MYQGMSSHLKKISKIHNELIFYDDLEPKWIKFVYDSYKWEPKWITFVYYELEEKWIENSLW